MSLTLRQRLVVSFSLARENLFEIKIEIENCRVMPPQGLVN